MTKLPKVVLCLLFPIFSYATDLKVISGGAIEPGLNAAVKAYGELTKNNIHLTYNTAPQIRKRLEAKESFDLVFAPKAVVNDQYLKQLFEGDAVSVGRVGLGVTVRTNTAKPKITSGDEFKSELLSAESIVFNKASSGQYFEKLLVKWGVYEKLLPRIVRYPDGESVMKHVIAGKGREIGVGPITEIKQFVDKGLVFVGPLSDDIQNYTQYFAVTMKVSKMKAQTHKFLDFLKSPAGQKHFKSAGID